MRKILALWSILLLFLACARVGRPTGGPKDTTPPKLIQSIPEPNATNFKGQEVVLYFDEYVILKNPQKNILISPPLAHQPVFKPAGIASKTVKIIFHDTLQPQTTYLINFGESITDYNEGNILKNLQLVFSTGKHIDSLTLSGHVSALHFAKPPKKIMLGLYDYNNFSDSLIFHQKPYYVTIADKMGQFKFTHLKQGYYKLIALDDENANYTYQQGKEGIGFIPQAINIPTDSLYNVSLFKEYPPVSIEKIEQLSRHHFNVEYEGLLDSLHLKWDMPIHKFTLQPYPKKAGFWYEADTDSLKFHIVYGHKSKSYRRKRLDKKDSLLVSIKSKGTMNPVDTLFITGNQPLQKLDTNLVILTSDSLPVDFKSIHLKGKFALFFDHKLGKSYQLQLLPKAVTGFLGTKLKDSISTSFKFPPKEKYGTLSIHLLDPPDTPFFIEILKNGKIYRQTKTQKQQDIVIPYLLPGKYRIRIISDLNSNNKWDSGNFLHHQLPEPVFEPTVPIEIRANWDINQNYQLEN